MLERMRYNKLIDGKVKSVYRKNPNYPPWHCFTTVKCKKCGEYYECCCEAKHICEKQNSYPYTESEVDE